MASTHGTLEVRTSGQNLYEITDHVARWLGNRPGSTGLLTLMIRHTSASLLIQENADPDVRTDLQAYLDRLAPSADHPDMDYLVHRHEGPDDMPAHIRAALLPTSLSIPVEEGRMRLGTWQGHLPGRASDPPASPGSGASPHGVNSEQFGDRTKTSRNHDVGHEGGPEAVFRAQLLQKTPCI